MVPKLHIVLSRCLDQVFMPRSCKARFTGYLSSLFNHLPCAWAAHNDANFTYSLTLSDLVNAVVITQLIIVTFEIEEDCVGKYTLTYNLPAAIPVGKAPCIINQVLLIEDILLKHKSAVLAYTTVAANHEIVSKMATIFAAHDTKINDDPVLASGAVIDVSHLNTVFIRSNFEYFCATVYATSFYCDNPHNPNVAPPLDLALEQNIVDTRAKIKKAKNDLYEFDQIIRKKTIGLERNKGTGAKDIEARKKSQAELDSAKQNIVQAQSELAAAEEFLVKLESEKKQQLQVFVGNDGALRNAFVHENCIWYYFEALTYDSATRTGTFDCSTMARFYVETLMTNFKTKFTVTWM